MHRAPLSCCKGQTLKIHPTAVQGHGPSTATGVGVREGGRKEEFTCVCQRETPKWPLCRQLLGLIRIC